MIDFFLFPDPEPNPKREPSVEEVEEKERQVLMAEYEHLQVVISVAAHEYKTANPRTEQISAHALLE